VLTETPRRLYLRAALKLLATAALIAVAAVLFGSLKGPGEPVPSVSVDVPLTALLPGEPRIIDWAGRPILVLRRSAAQLAALAEPAANDRPLVVYAVGRGAGCPLQLRGDSLRDRCDGVRYDLAGRVFPEQPVGRNLAVPPHHLRDGRLVIGTEG
jgi:ubiquinol-cytochrome c reductase iron-sulfur subunit